MQPTGSNCVERRPSFQDLIRRYTEFIDGQSVGRVHALQRASFPVSAGEHRVLLRIPRTGTSARAEFTVNGRAAETRVLRTRRHTSKDCLEAPLGIVTPDRHAPRPWTGLELAERRPCPCRGTWSSFGGSQPLKNWRRSTGCSQPVEVQNPMANGSASPTFASRRKAPTDVRRA